MEIEGTCASKNLDETVRLQSERKEEWIREIRGKRLQGIKIAGIARPVSPAHQQRNSPGETSI